MTARRAGNYTAANAAKLPSKLPQPPGVSRKFATQEGTRAALIGTRGTIGAQFDQFDDGKGTPVPPPDASGFRNDPIRQAVLKRLNASPAYRQLLAAAFPNVAAGEPIDFFLCSEVAERDVASALRGVPQKRELTAGQQRVNELSLPAPELTYHGKPNSEAMDDAARTTCYISVLGGTLGRETFGFV